MNKLQEFAEAAKKAEEEFAALNQAEEPASTPEPEPEPTPEPTAEPAPEEQPNAQEDKYKAAVKAMNEAQRKAAEASKREEEFVKRQQEMEAKLNEALEKLSKRPEPEEAQDELETDMPEVARLAELKAKRVLSPLEQKMSAIEAQLKALEEVRKQQETELNAKSMLSEIRKAHPDYDQVVNSDEMVAWINNDAPPIYKAIFDGSVNFTARDAIAVLNAYKSTTTPTPAKPTPSAAEFAAPIKNNPNIASKPQTGKPLTAKELDWFMHNSHKLNQTELAEWDARLSST